MEDLYSGLKALHGFLRWPVLLLLLIAIAKSFAGWLGKQEYQKMDKSLAMFGLMGAHIMLVVGLLLYFSSPLVQFESGVMKNADLRLWTLEHPLINIIGIVLITVGYSRAKRASDSVKKFKSVAIFFLIGLVLLLSRIPMDRWTL